MSIYGGFATRQQESTYNKAVYNLLYLMQLKVSRNNKRMPFDEHRFQQIFSKLYNRMFVMEDYKYLPPKYSYALKDLASDFGVFERMDVASMISGSTNLSMTTTSGFNVNFNDPPLKEKEVAFPLSPIKEQGRVQGQTQRFQKGQGPSSNGTRSNNSMNAGRFRNPVYNEAGGPSFLKGGRKGSKRTSPRRERSLEPMNSFFMQPKHNNSLKQNPSQVRSTKDRHGNMLNRSFVESGDLKRAHHPQTTINNNNIEQKLKQVNEETQEENQEQTQQADSPSNRALNQSKKSDYTPYKKEQISNGKFNQQMMMARSTENSLQMKKRNLNFKDSNDPNRFKSPVNKNQSFQNISRFTIKKNPNRKLRSLSPKDGQDNPNNYGASQNFHPTSKATLNQLNNGGNYQSEVEGSVLSGADETHQLRAPNQFISQQRQNPYGSYGLAKQRSNQSSTASAFRNNPYQRKFVRR